MSRTRPVRFRVLAALIVLSSLAALAPGASFAQDDDFTAAGLVSATGYVSPQHGYDVTWDDAWGVDPDRVDPVLWNKHDLDRSQHIPVYTREDGSYDRLDIWLPELDARLRVIVQETTNTIQTNAGPVGATANALGGHATRLLDLHNPGESVVVHRHSMNDGSVLLSYNQLVAGADGDHWIWVQLVAPEDAFPEAFARAQEDVTSDAFELGGAVTVDDVLAAAADVPPVDVSDYGITSATSWTSSTHGVEVFWSDRFTTFRNLERANTESSNRLYLGPKSGIPWAIEIGIWESRDDSTEALARGAIYAWDHQGVEILIAAIEGNRAIFLTRSASNDRAFVTYTEFSISADGETTTWAEIGAQLDDNAFARWFAQVAGAVTIDGVPFAGTYDPAWIIAAANAPVETGETGSNPGSVLQVAAPPARVQSLRRTVRR